MPAVARVSGLTKRYGRTTALEGLSVEIPAGLTGLVGANGAGKTTLFRLLLGLTHPTAGTVEVLGQQVAVDPVRIRSRIGYLPEHDCLPGDQSAADLVSALGELSGLPVGAARQRASEMLDLVGLGDERFRPMGGFSTGMRQRTKLAQALVADPSLVLLDEPTSGLDPTGRADMLDLIARLGSFGISVLLSTHVLDDVQRVCDHVVMLDGGKLVVDGPTMALLDGGRSVTVQVDADPHQLAQALAAAGLECEVLGSAVEVTSPDEAALDIIRDTVHELELPLVRLGSRLTSLEDVFVSKAGQP